MNRVFSAYDCRSDGEVLVTNSATLHHNNNRIIHYDDFVHEKQSVNVKCVDYSCAEKSVFEPSCKLSRSFVLKASDCEKDRFNRNTISLPNVIAKMVNTTEGHNLKSKESFEPSNQTLQIVNDVVAKVTPDNRSKSETMNKKLSAPTYSSHTPTTSNAPTTPITPCTPIMTVEELKQKFKFDENLSGESFPVSCRSAQGILYKNRLGSGKKGRCIKVNNEWMTPWEFESLGGRSGSKDWKRSIRYQGRPINDLMMANFISFHAPSCTCRICSDDPSGTAVPTESAASSASVRYFTPYKRKARAESSSNQKPPPTTVATGLSNAKKLKTLVAIAPSPASGTNNGSPNQRPVLNSSKSLPASTQQNLLAAISSASALDGSGTLSSTPISQVAAIGGGSNSAIYLSNVDQNIQNQQQQQQQHHMHSGNHQIGLGGVHANSNGVNMSANLLSAGASHAAGNHSAPNNNNNNNNSNSSLAALVPALESISNQITHLGSQVELILNAVKKDIHRDSSPQPRGGATANGEIISYVPSGSSTAIQLKNEKVCNNCGRETTSMCSGCNKAYYCSDFCIQKDWGNHANFCDVQPILTPASPQKMQMQSIFNTSVLSSLNLDNNSKQQQNSNTGGPTTQIYLAAGAQHQQGNTAQIINASNSSLNAVTANNSNSGGPSNSTILLNSTGGQGMQLSLPKQLNLIPNSLNSNSASNCINVSSHNDSLNRNSSNDLNQDQITTANAPQQFLFQTSSGATLVLPANFLTNINSNVAGATTIPISEQEALENILAPAS